MFIPLWLLVPAVIVLVIVAILAGVGLWFYIDMRPFLNDRDIPD